MSFSQLLERNPWWKDVSEIDNDPEIKTWKNSKLKWRPRISQTFQKEDLVYSLRGPRQVGKTTLVKLMIHDLLKTYPKWNIMYYAFDVDNKPTDVVNIINDYMTRAKIEKKFRCWIFLDEISDVNNWSKAIKKLHDEDKFVNCTIIATGSHSIDLINASELLPGRGDVTDNDAIDKVLLPMKFAEFVSAIDTKLSTEIQKIHLISREVRFAIIRELSEGKINPILNDLSAYQNELDKHFETYLITGGLPLVVNHFLEDHIIKDGMYNVYLKYIRGDLNKNRRDFSIAMRIMPNIIKSLTNGISWRDLTDDTDLNHHTTEEYVTILSQMFILKYFYQYNHTARGPKYDGLKKIYFQDPFFLHALNGWLAQKDPYQLSLNFVNNTDKKSYLVENIVSDHCTRLAFNLSSSKSLYNYHQSVFYWKGTKREVDFVVKDNDSLIPIEVKYQNDIKSDDYHGLIDFRKMTGRNSIMITKKDLKSENDIALIPTSMFLLLV